MKKIMLLVLITSVISLCVTAQRRLEFRPAVHGFHFANRFNTLTDFADIRTNGLCGGMCLAAFNFFRYKIPIPNQTDKTIDFNVTYHVSPAVTSGTTALVDYLFHSQMAMNFTNVSALYFTNDLHKNYDEEFANIQRRLDRGTYVILGLKLRPNQKGRGHQVLCYGYDVFTREMYVYDPNFPDMEITICKSGDDILLKHGSDVVSDVYKSFFEQQELFVNRTSNMFTYNAIENVLRDLNYAVHPPEMQDAPVMAGFGYKGSNFNYEQALPAQSVYKFQNEGTSKWMEVEDAVFAKGTKVQQYFGYERNGVCDGRNQQWLLIPAGIVGTEPTFFIINFGFLKYLEAGSDATVQPGNDNDNQRWFIQPAGQDGVYHIKSVAAQTYLEMPAGFTNDGDRFKLAAFTGTANQRFRFTQFVGLTGPQRYTPGTYITFVPQTNEKTAAYTDLNLGNGAAIKLADLQSAVQQNKGWQLVSTGDGYCKIQSRIANNMVVDILGNGENGNGLTIWNNAPVEKQKWLVVPVVREDGNYVLFNKVSGRCVSLEKNLPQIQTTLFVNGSNQKWKLMPVD